jgi:hypothetical protein
MATLALSLKQLNPANEFGVQARTAAWKHINNVLTKDVPNMKSGFDYANMLSCITTIGAIFSLYKSLPSELQGTGLFVPKRASLSGILRDDKSKKDEVVIKDSRDKSGWTYLAMVCMTATLFLTAVANVNSILFSINAITSRIKN